MGLPKSLGDVTTVTVQVYGDRNFPIAAAKLGVAHVSDLAAIILGMQMLQPELTPEDVIRAIWRTGSATIAKGLASGTHLRVPPVQPVPVPPERYRANSNGE